jgi:hypothetical protein
MLGFGTFKLTHRKARKGRNPKTGEEIQIKASNTPSFSAGKAFKEKCNEWICSSSLLARKGSRKQVLSNYEYFRSNLNNNEGV